MQLTCPRDLRRRVTRSVRKSSPTRVTRSARKSSPAPQHHNSPHSQSVDELHDLPDLVTIDQDDELADTADVQPTVHTPPDVDGPLFSEVVSMFHPQIKFPDCLRSLSAKDSFFKKIMDEPQSFPTFSIQKRLILLHDCDEQLLCIPNGCADGISVRETIISHAHSLLAHLSGQKTFHYLHTNIWWPGMFNDIIDYCKSCHTCAIAKPQNQKSFGYLRPLPVPHRRWQQVGIDFVGPLPGSTNRHGEFDMICVIIDHFSSMIHLVPSRSDYRARDIAELMFENVYKLHGPPEILVSDRDSLFTSGFWEHLHKMTNSELRMSTAFYPQTDGATEHANRTLTQMLRMTIEHDQKNWVQRLPSVEYAFNLAQSDTTGYSPFFLNMAVPHAHCSDTTSTDPCQGFDHSCGKYGMDLSLHMIQY